MLLVDYRSGFPLTYSESLLFPAAEVYLCRSECPLDPRQSRVSQLCQPFVKCARLPLISEEQVSECIKVGMPITVLHLIWFSLPSTFETGSWLTRRPCSQRSRT